MTIHPQQILDTFIAAARDETTSRAQLVTGITGVIADIGTTDTAQVLALAIERLAGPVQH